MKPIRNIAVFFVLTIAGISNGFSQQGAMADSAEIKQVIIHLFDGIAEIDSGKIISYVTKDFLLLEDGLIWNTDSLIRVLRPLKSQDFKRTNEFRFVSHEQSGNMTWVVYYNTAHIVFNGQNRDINWLESAVLVKEDNRWKVKVLHSTMLRKPSSR
jgi:ketosteroid isomerase-like protein